MLSLRSYAQVAQVHPAHQLRKEEADDPERWSYRPVYDLQDGGGMAAVEVFDHQGLYLGTL